MCEPSTVQDRDASGPMVQKRNIILLIVIIANELAGKYSVSDQTFKRHYTFGLVWKRLCLSASRAGNFVCAVVQVLSEPVFAHYFVF